MGLITSRKRLFARGLGGLDVRQIDPSVWPTFSTLGWHESSKIDIAATMEELIDETGGMADVLRKDVKTHFTSQLMQSGIDEINLIRNAGDGVYNVRFYGTPGPGVFQYWCFEQCKIAAKIPLDFKPGKRLLPVDFYAIDASNAYGFPVPPYFFVQRAGVISLVGLQFWFSPGDLIDYGLAYAIDISGYANHGTIADVASWQTSGAVTFLQHNGSSQYEDFGATCGIDATSDVLIECWVRPQAANGAALTFIGKKPDATTGAGWLVGRDTGNHATLVLADGGSDVVLASTATLLQNVWHHVAVAVVRNGGATMYVDGVAGGGGAVASIGGSTGTSTFRFARTGNTYYQIDLGGVRFANYGAGGLPANAAAIIAAHFAAERSYYGV